MSELRRADVRVEGVVRGDVDGVRGRVRDGVSERVLREILPRGRHLLLLLRPWPRDVRRGSGGHVGRGRCVREVGVRTGVVDGVVVGVGVVGDAGGVVGGCVVAGVVWDDAVQDWEGRGGFPAVVGGFA